MIKRERTNENAEARRRDICMVSLRTLEEYITTLRLKDADNYPWSFPPPEVVANNTTRLSWFHPRKSPARTNHRTSNTHGPFHLQKSSQTTQLD
jgi:hypothetical protein